MPWLQLYTLDLVISLSLTFFILFCFFTVKLLSHYFSANRVFFFLGEFKVWQEHSAPWLTSYDRLLCCELPGSRFPRRSASSRACSSEVGGSLSTFPHHHFYSFNNLLNCLWLNVSRLKTPCTSFLFAKDLAIKAAVNQLHKCIEFMIIKPSFQDLSVPLQLSRETERDTAVAVQQTAEWMEGGREGAASVGTKRWIGEKSKSYFLLVSWRLCSEAQNNPVEKFQDFCEFSCSECLFLSTVCGSPVSAVQPRLWSHSNIHRPAAYKDTVAKAGRGGWTIRCHGKVLRGAWENSILTLKHADLHQF